MRTDEPRPAQWRKWGSLIGVAATAAGGVASLWKTAIEARAARRGTDAAYVSLNERLIRAEAQLDVLRTMYVMPRPAPAPAAPAPAANATPNLARRSPPPRPVPAASALPAPAVPPRADTLDQLLDHALNARRRAAPKSVNALLGEDATDAAR